MSKLVESIDHIAQDLRAVLAGSVRSEAIGALRDDEVVGLLSAAGEVQRRLDAIVAETVAEAERRSRGPRDEMLTSRYGCRSVNELVQRTLRVDARAGAQLVKAARIVRRDADITSGAMLPAKYPQLREALLAGAISVSGLLAATEPLEASGPRVGVADRLRADAQLAAYARGGDVDDSLLQADGRPDAGDDPAPAATPDDLRVLSQVIVTYLDPDGAEPADKHAMVRRALTLGRPRDGLVPIRGDLLPEAAGQLQRIFDAFLSPKTAGPPMPGEGGVRFWPSVADAPGATPGSDAGDDAGDDAPPEGRIDDRSRSQKQHDALAAALMIAARHDDMPTIGGAAPTLVVSVTAEDFARGRGWAQVQGVDVPVPVSVAAQTACAGGVQRVLFDERGAIVGIGTSDRIFNAHQRRAIILRDEECVIPGCHVPSGWCEIHHVSEHSQGGATHTGNGVAVCWFHHRTLHMSGWEIRMVGGLPEIRGPAWWDPRRKWRRPRSARLRTLLRAGP